MCTADLLSPPDGAIALSQAVTTFGKVRHNFGGSPDQMIEVRKSQVTGFVFGMVTLRETLCLMLFTQVTF